MLGYLEGRVTSAVSQARVFGGGKSKEVPRRSTGHSLVRVRNTGLGTGYRVQGTSYKRALHETACRVSTVTECPRYAQSDRFETCCEELRIPNGDTVMSPALEVIRVEDGVIVQANAVEGESMRLGKTVELPQACWS